MNRAVDSALECVVVGGGQAGLSASYYLSAHHVDHVVLERGRIGERWRSERWDSLRFQFPGRYVRLPGLAYDGPDTEAFMHRDGIVKFIEDYAHHIHAPVRCGVTVRRISRADDGGFVLDLGQQNLRARNVILATGPYQRTLVPQVSEMLPHSLYQLPASAYTRADALPEGAVLVVGAGGSGVQIAEDLLSAGRQTYLCVGKHRRIPRSYRGRDIMDWFEELNLTSGPAVNLDPSEHAPLLTGIDGGYEVDLRRLVANGGHLLGRLEGYEAGELILGQELFEHMTVAEAAYAQIIAGLEQALAARDPSVDPGPAPPPPEAPGPMPPMPPARLNLADSGITSVIWATGYGVDFSWVDCGEYKPDGMPVQERGVSTEPGLYFLGLAFLYSARSSFFWGVGEDADHVVQHLVARKRD